MNGGRPGVVPAVCRISLLSTTMPLGRLDDWIANCTTCPPALRRSKAPTCNVDFPMMGDGCDVFAGGSISETRPGGLAGSVTHWVCESGSGNVQGAYVHCCTPGAGPA